MFSKDPNKNQKENNTSIMETFNKMFSKEPEKTQPPIEPISEPISQSPILLKNESKEENKNPLGNPIEIKLINQGAFGCVFRPNIKCDGKIGNKRYVTKIQLQKENIKNELIISNKIKTIHNYQYFFAPLLHSCNVSISSIKEEQRNNCDLLKNATNKENINSQTSFLSTKIRYVGNKNLEQYFLSLLIFEYLKSVQDKKTLSYLKNENNLKSYIKNKTYLQSLKTLFTPTPTSINNPTPHFFFQNTMTKKMTSTYYHLLKAIQKLQEINIIHFDIKELNIIYDEWNHSPMIIDMGISFDLSTLPTKEEQHNYFYTEKFYLYWCIDIFIINYIVNVVRLDPIIYKNKITQEQVKSINTQFFEELKNPRYLGSFEHFQQDIIDFESRTLQFLESFVGKEWEELFDFLFKKELYSTWDNYSLAMTYTLISKSIHFIEYNNNESKHLIKLWKSILFAVPGERKNVEQTMEEWTNYV
jgi:serine/threonine protein kinase